ncbi:MAG: lipoyl synthase, partial [Nanoarchaeota archaeon]|nr:lipoyl synthase [Nanoarchaeota archaeon]
MQDLVKPDWIRVTYKHDANIEAIKKDAKEKGLATVCQEARCPNIWECWSSGTATFMLMGDTCTRGCAFCHVKTARFPGKLDPLEHEKLLESIKRMNLSYVVLTSVDRDDLPDQGANHLAMCIQHLKKNLPDLRIEILIGDFQGNLSLIQHIIDARPDVLAHNIETTERLTPKVRDRRAGYRQSLAVLKGIKEMAPHI